MNSSTVGQGSTTGRARSCTGCRQVKLACDARRTAPQPCSRCKSKGLQCKFDNNFKRIPTRRIAQEITNELHQLRPSTDAEKQPISFPTDTSRPQVENHLHPDLSNAAVTTDISSYTQTHSPSQPNAQSWLHVVKNDYSLNYVLGNVEVDPETAVSLFKHFDLYYISHAPFLKPIHSLSRLATQAPLLFWTIILVSSRDHDQHDELYEHICAVQGVVCSQIMYTAIQTIEEIHALLLLCLWPIPRQRQIHDPGWNYIGIAANAAMQLNCHLPLSENSILSDWKGMSDSSGADIGLRTQHLTWIHCFEIGVRLAMSHGLHPPLSTPTQLRSISKAASSISSIVNQGEQARAEIYRLSSVSTLEVDNTSDLQVRHSLIMMFDEQFNALSSTFKGPWTACMDIELLAAKLYLYGMTFAIENDQIVDEVHRANRQLIYMRILETAANLISKMVQLQKPISESSYPAGIVTFFPKHYFMSLHLASVNLFRVLAGHEKKTRQETAAAIHSLTEAHKIFQSFPYHRDAVKAAINIEELVKLVRQSATVHPRSLNEMVITNRLGASVMFDATFRLAYDRNRHPITGASPPPVTEWVTQDQEYKSILPRTPEQRASRAGSNSNLDADDIANSQLLTTASGAGWTDWDNYMFDFEVGPDSWAAGNTADQSISMNPSAHITMEDAFALPVLGQSFNDGYLKPSMPAINYSQ